MFSLFYCFFNLEYEARFRFYACFAIYSSSSTSLPFSSKRILPSSLQRSHRCFAISARVPYFSTSSEYITGASNVTLSKIRDVDRHVDALSSTYVSEQGEALMEALKL